LEICRGQSPFPWAGSVWAAPAPQGVVAARQLRVELPALQPLADGRRLRCDSTAAASPGTRRALSSAFSDTTVRRGPMPAPRSLA